LDQSTVKLEIDQLSNNNKILKNGGTAFFGHGWMDGRNRLLINENRQ